MPYRTEIVPAELFMEHNGVRVYHVYRNDDIDSCRLDYWFTTDEYGSECGDAAFDVREKAIKWEFPKAFRIMDVIKFGIINGLIVQREDDDAI